MTEFQLGYHVAMIDGEGSIYISKAKVKSKYLKYQAVIAVSNTNIAMLGYLKTTSEMGNIWPQKQKINHKPAWEWILRTNELKPYLLQIKDHLIIKRQQAELMLEFLETFKKFNKYNPPSQDILILREVIYDEMLELNKRGL